MPSPTTRRILLASTALTTLVLASSLPAAADDATWIATPPPIPGDFNTGANWDIGTVPTGTASFGASGVTSLTFSNDVTIGGLTFNAGNYSIATNDRHSLTFTGAGILVSGGSATFDLSGGDKSGGTFFTNSSTAGSASFSASYVVFRQNSTAGNATITTNARGTGTSFKDDSKAGSATLINVAQGSVRFNDRSTADHATIANKGTIGFFGSSSAGNATITNQTDGSFYESDKGPVLNPGGVLRFFDSSTGGNTTLINQADATVNVSGSSGPNGDGKLSAGSIAGAGSYILGANELTVGGNGNSTEVSGVISGVGGSLVKTGIGTMILSGANTYTGGTTISGGALQIGNGGTSGSITGNIDNNAALIFNRADELTYSDVISGSGTVEKRGIGTLILTGAQTYTGGTTISAGTLQLGSSVSAGAIRGAVNVGAVGTFVIYNADTTGITNMTNAGSSIFLALSSAGTATITNRGSLNFRDASTAGASNITNTAVVAFSGDSKAGTATISNERSSSLIFSQGSRADNAHITNRGTVWFAEGSKASNARIENKSGDVNFLHGTSAENATIINDDRVLFGFAATAGSATIVNNTGGTVDFSGSTGPNNDGKLSAGSIAGAGKYILGSDELTVGANNTSTEVSGIISGTGGALVKAGTGTLLLSGTNTYTGATTVNAGTLSVNGSIASSSGVTVNNGGTLGGTGQLPGVIVNTGGTLAPGNSIGTITVNGNLQFGAGSFYTVEVSPSSSDRTNVKGTATLTGATVRAAALPGSFRGQTYTIVNATAGLGGTQFAGLTVSGSFAPARNPHLTYDANSAYLVLDPGTLALGQGATRNQTSVAGAINRAVESGGAPPAGFDTLLNMGSDAAGRALDQLSGESSTQGQTGAFQLGNSFLALLTDVVGTRRDDGRAAPLSYAGERPGTSAAARSAFAGLDKAPVAYAPRWDVWGTAFGGGTNLSGDPAGTGSRDALTRAGAVAAGADYRFTPNSLVGFSLAGGSMTWSAGNGGGSSDAFMAGVYGKHTSGPIHVAAAASYANYWMSTTRTVTVAGLDQLKANFNAESFGGRIEAGYRLPARFLDVTWTPYGAIQGQSFRTPDYTEAAALGSNQFALRYAGRTATAIRAELGLNTERLIAIDRGSELSLFGRTAYAHDSVSNPAVAANFAVLGPTGGFTTLGAQPSQHLLLSSAGAEWRLASGVSFMLQADSEWGERSRTYSGTGRIRYTW